MFGLRLFCGCKVWKILLSSDPADRFLGQQVCCTRLRLPCTLIHTQRHKNAHTCVGIYVCSQEVTYVLHTHTHRATHGYTLVSTPRDTLLWFSDTVKAPDFSFIRALSYHELSFSITLYTRLAVGCWVIESKGKKAWESIISHGGELKEKQEEGDPLPHTDPESEEESWWPGRQFGPYKSSPW